MRIVLMGYKDAGKSASGNIILGREKFDTSGRTAESVMKEGETAGRHITVVEAPGWWNSSYAEETPERDKREIILSLSLCPPGPHALLLTVRIDSPFTEIHRRAVQEHLELLGESVWSHTIVLFTCGDCLGETTTEQYIEGGGKALQWLVEKCENRYHVVDNMKRDACQVTELLDKIEETVVGNSGHHFTFDGKVMKGLSVKKKEEDGRAEQRKMAMQKQGQALGSPAGKIQHISDMRILLLGNRRAGKSSSGNTILGREEFNTSERTSKCEKRTLETEGRHITIVEAPDWWKNISEEETTESDKKEIVHSVSLCHPGPHALLLVIDVSESFIETHRRALQEHLELLSEKVWSHTIVLFTNGDWLGKLSIEQYIESGGIPLKWLVKKCGERYHVFNNRERTDRAQVTKLLNTIENMVAENRGCCYEFISQPVKQARSTDLPPEMGRKSLGYYSGHTDSCDDLPQLQMELSRVFITKLPYVDENTIKILGDKLIGSGAFGGVYKGSYRGTPAAIKMLPIGNNPPDTLEFIIPLRLSHPHIVRMMAVTRTDSNILIANEYIHGENLGQIIHTNSRVKLDGEEKLYVAFEIAIAVEYIHGKNVIHQDIKPANILISERTKTAYLTDWGLANMQDSLSQLGVARHGRYCGPQGGTESYVAPELLLDDKECTTMSDMWSLGVTYLEMFTNSVPWKCNSRRGLLGMLNKQEPPHALGELQPCHDDVVKPLIEYDPQSRKTASDLVQLLKSRLNLTSKYGFEW